MSQNLADALTPANRRESPYPHYVATAALDADHFRALSARFPDDALVRQGKPPGDNRRFSWPAAEAIDDARLDPLWRQTLALHVGQSFLDGVLRALTEDIHRSYPWLEEAVGRPLPQWRAGVRNRDRFDTCEVLIDAQPSINSPVLGAGSSVRGPHIDKPHKLFAGLYYLRPDSDTDTPGGELVVYRHLREQPQFEDAQIDPAHVEETHRVAYAGNTLVLFLNSLEAVHGVTARPRTPHTRRFLNIVGEVRPALFDLAARQRRRSPLARTAAHLRALLQHRRG
ncbi:MAG TPA: 2OG-Fe(II) oxygenase [Xanthomonadaceae bacterium]|nr:2OG-Fe(II) oxygenase [Xanthomonadaceae bacterium]